ncbi:hypothetical protein CDAR_538561 [Caerostris darwini]|uniref:Uncharacterized protein n=1 Tax=Caerostris darwini TaxID=1538125 RepID=A0AAV4UCN2_9ARAC|nr:hypothetical protein CDAR_538561 [Caerostris darwini]
MNKVSKQWCILLKTKNSMDQYSQNDTSFIEMKYNDLSPIPRRKCNDLTHRTERKKKVCLASQSTLRYRCIDRLRITAHLSSLLQVGNITAAMVIGIFRYTQRDCTSHCTINQTGV